MDHKIQDVKTESKRSPNQIRKYLLVVIGSILGVLIDYNSQIKNVHLPFDPKTAKTSPECTVADTSLRITPVLIVPNIRWRHDPGSI